MFTIGQFSRITGLTVKTIRLYHEKDVLKPAWVDDETGYRYFDQADAERARVIRHLRDLEFPLAEIRELVEAQGVLWVTTSTGLWALDFADTPGDPSDDTWTRFDELDDGLIAFAEDNIIAILKTPMATIAQIGTDRLGFSSGIGGGGVVCGVGRGVGFLSGGWTNRWRLIRLLSFN